MVFKFGILVLLFALDGVFAKQGLPTDPTVNLVSALQRVPHLRRGLTRTYHSPDRNFRSTTFRRSLQSTEETCEWDADTEECSPSISSMKNLLEESDTEFAGILVEYLNCIEKTSKVDCNAEAACLWENAADGCSYLDSRRNHEDSPCAKAAPLVFDLLEASVLCEKQSSSRSCESNRQCAWSSENVYCDVDRFLILYGIKNFQEKATQLEDSEEAALRSEYESLRLSNDFTWQSMLDYKPRRISCPPGVERLVCKYVDAFVPHILGPAVYCSGKYEFDPSGCAGDTRCTWNAVSARCERDES